jgi:hypothetical protein
MGGGLDGSSHSEGRSRRPRRENTDHSLRQNPRNTTPAASTPPTSIWKIKLPDPGSIYESTVPPPVTDARGFYPSRRIR